MLVTLSQKHQKANMPPKNTELTTTNRAAWMAFKKLTDRLGTEPSVRQLAAALGVSHQAAHYQIGQLREKGYLGERRITARRLMLTAKGRQAK